MFRRESFRWALGYGAGHHSASARAARRIQHKNVGLAQEMEAESSKSHCNRPGLIDRFIEVCSLGVVRRRAESPWFRDHIS